MITLESFVTLKKLTINNIHIEPKKVKASYNVENFAGEIDSTELIYTYEHTYFDKKNPHDVNLASMMLSQVALNYGLFFETIELDGLFDKTDQKFLLDMLENTSVEILTNKLLKKNEYIKGPYDTLVPEKRKKYTQAKVVFNNNQFKNHKIIPEKAKTDFNKYAILSSGGKDSLLSYGIIKEIGEAYPIFINEAGRHWFTAINAHRYFKKIEPNTEKPWCNSDRVFNWMVKKLPFIKENQGSIKSDMYPIRLWTVAVFLFGVLPIVRKKGIENVLIGDEYDTTVLGNIAGIKHYNALFDQSKYFDNILSKYYQKKGWHIYQFSILRSLGELLIMKILTKRYPELQEQQVSCHSAHDVNGRMYPCGNCEKCRRIVGMLEALNENPQRCGYSEIQITKGLEALAKKSIKQLDTDASHLYHILLKKNLLEKNEFTKKIAKEHPEIEKIRFDKERSNLEDLPKYIRKPLFSIYQQYANGAVQRQNNKWKAIEISNAFLNEKNYILDEK